ncbi:peptidoglycan DD-metalloendopeptidase family protein [Desulfovibrio sp. OttesenSCG-928-G11]|nr:peptidoglycan DD-metalloendopeptidase family protein [Desulfovibrio sp. OttesenSCG-928-G11]
MNSALPIDPAMAVSEATSSDLIRRKLDMDALRKRLGDQSTKDEKLRESCEGFEAIFLQKMWEQMRKNVPKEGYLHSKDEETYQSLFDVELCKKMASAGGIGLADMLYQQLSQQLEDTGRTTTPSTYRRPLDIDPSGALMAAVPALANAKTPDKTLKAEDLYSPLPEEEQEEESGESPEQVNKALEELRAELDDSGEAVREWAEARAEATGVPIRASVATGPVVSNESADRAETAARPNPGPLAAAKAAPEGAAAETGPGQARAEAATASSGAPSEDQTPDQSPAQAQTTAQAQAQTPAQAVAGAEAPGADQAVAAAETVAAKAKDDGIDPALLSWQGPGPVSVKPKPVPLFGRDKTAPAAKTQSKAVTQPRGMAPDETLWPVSDAGSPVLSRFGWEDDPVSGKRRWNAGVKISAEPQTPVRAVLAGTVVYAGQREGSGHTVVLEHSGGFRSYYGRLEPGSVKVGDKIRAGSEFAKTAAEPSSPENGEKSAFLHFELKKGEMALNPESAINRDAKAG